MGRLTKNELLSGVDLDERDVELPKLGGSVRVRALPAAYSLQAASDATEMKQTGNDQFINVNRAKLEIIQALHGLVDPKLANYAEAEQFAQQCGPSFSKVIQVIDELSEVDKEAMTEAGERFPAVGKGSNGTDLADAVAAGMVDEMFLYELAETLHKSVRELTTGEPGMSAHELCVGWPTYFRFKERARERAETEANERSRRV